MSATLEIIAHRGAPRERPENTLSAFALALDHGADAIELDVHATSDGVVVVHHDPVPRARASDDALRGRPIARMTHAELRGFVVGEDERIPTLEEVLTLVRGRATAYVEIKGAAIEDRVVDVIRRSGAECAVHSFDHRVARRVRELDPTLPTGILLSSYLLDPAAALRAAGARDFWQQWEFVDGRLVDDVRRAGGRVMAWTVNSVAAARSLVDMGVVGICSDVAGELGPRLRDRARG